MPSSLVPRARNRTLLFISICVALVGFISLGADRQHASGAALRHTSRYFAATAPVADKGVITPDAATITVNSTADVANGSDGLCTLREAITAANVNTASGAVSGECGAGSSIGDDTINFSVTGTINLTGALPDISTNVLLSGPGSASLTVRRDTGGDYRVFTIFNGPTVTISGMTISNGNTVGNFPANSGAGIWNNHSTLTIRDTTISGNTASFGIPSGFGSGIYNDSSNGGSATLNVINSLITGNSCGGNGGGIFNDGTNHGSATLTITNSTISNNSAGSAGALLNSGQLAGNASARITNSTISGNSAQIGGGISNGGTQAGNASLTIVNSTISGNGAAVIGGGFVNQEATIKITNSTITNNRADTDNTSTGGDGGALFNFGGNITLRNTILARNFHRSGPIADDISNAGVDTVNSSFNVIGTGGAGGLVNGVNNNQVGVSDPGLAPLASNGGPTLTHALLSSSPALDAGDNCVTQAAHCGDASIPQLTTDQRGNGYNRIVDGPDGDATATVDIGAFEQQPPLAAITDASSNEDVQFAVAFDVGDPALVTSITGTSDNPILVPNDPANINVTGSSSTRALTINPTANLFGTANITITLNTTSGSTSRTFQLTVNSSNDAPSFTKGPDQTVNENAGPQTVNGWATNLSAGPADESGQTLAFLTTNNTNPGLFAAAPAISSTGTLTFTPATGISGTAFITVALMDNGGTANGGQDTTSQTFNITVRDGGTLQFNSTFYSTAENTSATITIIRIAGSAGTATVNFSTSNGTASSSDYTPVNTTVSFLEGETSKTVNVPITDDVLDEQNETVNLTLSNAGGTGQVGSPATAVLTINDNDPPPTLAINDVALTEGDSGAKAMNFTVILTGATALTVSTGFATSNGTASNPSDYLTSSGTVTFNPGETTKTISVTINGDVTFENNETFSVNLFGAISATYTDSLGIGTILNDDSAGGAISFSLANYNTTEGSGTARITVQRANDTTRAATVDYATSEDSGLVSCATASGTASSKCDFTAAIGTLRFAANETSKTFDVLISQDSYVEGPESLTLTLSNLTGGATFAAPSTATLTIADDLTEPSTNVIDDADGFVRAHYHDFLNREADASGLAFWTNQITSCGSDQMCIQLKRINVSAAFYISVEFQQTGYLVERIYKAAYGDTSGLSTLGGAHQLTVPIVRLNEFLPDTQRIGQGVVVNVGNWQQQLEDNKVAYLAEFVQRTRFTDAYPAAMPAPTFVDKLNANAGNPLSTDERNQLIVDLAQGNTTRAQVLRAVAEDPDLVSAESNRAFVLMQYFGYLRRNPNDPQDSDYTGYDFWLTKLNQFSGNFVAAEMVKAFISSGEYRQRFGP